MARVWKEQLALLSDLCYAEVPYWYGATRRPLRLDVVCPRSRAARPLLLWFCGGAFQQMDHHLWIPELMWYAQRGFTVASAEYRVGAAGGWPAPIEDAWAAVRYLRKNARELAIDGSRIAVMGESAGGYIASCLGLGVGRPEDCAPVQAAVDLYGVADIRTMAAYEIELKKPSICELMGGTEAEQPERYAAGDLLAHVSSQSAPFFILHGLADKRVPPSQSERLCNKLLAAGAQARLMLVPGATHGDPRLYEDGVKEEIHSFLSLEMKAGR